MSKLTKSILAAIEQKKITPRAKAWFQTKNALVWGLAVLAIILAGILFAALIRELLEAEWNIAARYPGGSLHFLCEAVSFIWLGGILSAFAISYVFFRQTKHGYRYGVFAVGGVLLVTSLVLASSLMPTGVPQGMHDFREKQLGIPAFDETPWLNPDAGFLIGDIQEAQATILILDAFDNTIWRVGISDADIAPMVKLQVGEEIRALGKKTGDNSFEAEMIIPGKPIHMMHMMMFSQGDTSDNSERNLNSSAYQLMQAR
ncbi:MAG: hypothetical protein PHO48_02105 [Candidatus Gracilibacteria bacterium]|nr:hypothetical protein [Candidatus Gracilibacteria bacterium]MDD5178849.1 hypothetical protein [Candidatus Gracilibacteria bacterium]